MATEASIRVVLIDDDELIAAADALKPTSW